MRRGSGDFPRASCHLLRMLFVTRSYFFLQAREIECMMAALIQAPVYDLRRSRSLFAVQR